MPTIRGTVERAGDPIGGAYVVAQIVASVKSNPPAFVPSVPGDTVGPWTTTTGPDGTWAFPLIENALISPAGTVYKFIYRVPGAQSSAFYRQVLDQDADVDELPSIDPNEHLPSALTGDGRLTGNSLTVTGLQGHPVSDTDPASGDSLIWSGTEWEPDPGDKASAAGLAQEILDRIGADSLLIPLTQKGAADGVAELDGNGLVPTTQLPPVSISGQTFDVASEAAMLALAANPGDTAIRSDMNPDGFFVLRALPASTLANWFQVLSPGSVLSVDGRIGTVSLSDLYDAFGAYNRSPVRFGKAGTVAVARGKAPEPISVPCTISSITAVVDTAPVGADMIFDLLKNGVVVATVTIADGTNAATVSASVACSPGDLLTLDVVQVGLTIAGWDLTVKVLFA